MNEEGRRELVNQLVYRSGLKFSAAAVDVLNGIVAAIDEAASDDDQLRQDTEKLTYDQGFLNWLTRDSGGSQTVRGVNVLHAVQDLRLNLQLARRYRIFNQIKPDTD